jgi:hypothetical protein
MARKDDSYSLARASEASHKPSLSRKRALTDAVYRSSSMFRSGKHANELAEHELETLCAFCGSSSPTNWRSKLPV